MFLLKPCFFTLEIILSKSALNKHDGTKQVSYFVIKTNQEPPNYTKMLGAVYYSLIGLHYVAND